MTERERERERESKERESSKERETEGEVLCLSCDGSVGGGRVVVMLLLLIFVARRGGTTKFFVFGVLIQLFMYSTVRTGTLRTRPHSPSASVGFCRLLYGTRRFEHEAKQEPRTDQCINPVSHSQSRRKLPPSEPSFSFRILELLHRRQW
jgi:hypothetical protein